MDYFDIWAHRLEEPERRHSDNDVSAAAEALHEPPAVWVFGYGSLCWYPGFEYTKCITGYIRGYTRKFWQGNTTHRGTPDKVSFIAIFHLIFFGRGRLSDLA